MPGYAVDTPNSGQPFGTSVFDGLRTVQAPTYVDLYTKYPQSTGPTRAANPNLPTFGIVHAFGFPNQGSALLTTTVNWQNAGDQAVFCVAPATGTNRTLSTLTSNRVTNWSNVTDYWDSFNGFGQSLWIGTVASAGSDTITWTWTPSAPASNQWVVDELDAGFGALSVWSTVTYNAQTAASATSWLYPSLTSGAGTRQMYWGYGQGAGPTISAGTTTGFGYWTTIPAVYLVTSNGLLQPSTAYQPNGTASGANATAVTAMIVNAVQGTLSGPNYATVAADLGGATGSWSNTGNADGAPDSAYATWTAP